MGLLGYDQWRLQSPPYLEPAEKVRCYSCGVMDEPSDMGRCRTCGFRLDAGEDPPDDDQDDADDDTDPDKTPLVTGDDPDEHIDIGGES